MSERYILAIDQSTSGTKALLLNSRGEIAARHDIAHKQKIDARGYVSHDPMEIYRNTLRAAAQVLEVSGIDSAAVAGVGISNQRETALVWDRESGLPVCDAVVWQCTRGEAVCARLADRAESIRRKTGLFLSPYFSAAKIAWILENAPVGKKNELCAGTIDSWLIFKLTGNHKTDASNASRTQLMDIARCAWDREICEWFDIPPEILPEINDSNACFGHTDFEGLLPYPIPVHGVLGDSHGALLGHGCLRPGMAKVTYGTGSSVMVNIGDAPAFSDCGLVTSLAWRMDGKASYVLEGNINYSCAVIKWLVEDVGLLASPREAGWWAAKANPDDQAYLVPAFSGLGAPHWDSRAKAALTGMSRTTGKAEIVKAAEECIAYQITDVIRAAQRDTALSLAELRADGGGSGDAYLMQFQSDMLNMPLSVAQNGELSATGAAFAAGFALGIYDETFFSRAPRITYIPQMNAAARDRKYAGWLKAVRGTRSREE